MGCKAGEHENLQAQPLCILLAMANYLTTCSIVLFSEDAYVRADLRLYNPGSQYITEKIVTKSAAHREHDP